MPQILWLGEHNSHGVSVPVVGPCHIHIVFVGTAAPDGKVIGGTLHFFFCQDFRNFVLPIPLQHQMIDTTDNGGSFLIDDPVVFVLRVFPVAVDGMGGGMLPRGTFDFVGSGYLAGLIPQIPLVHDVQKRGELVAVLILAVHAVGDGNKMNPMLTKEYLGVKARLQVITPCPAHVLDNHPADLSGFNVGNHALPIGTLKIAA